MKKCSLFLFGIIAISFICTGCFSKKELVPFEKEPEQKTVIKHTNNIRNEERKYDLYADTPYDLPLISVAEISKLPENIKEVIDSILEKSQGFYYLKVNENSNVFIILQNSIQISNTYPRHNLQFIEIDKDGVVTSHLAGYNGLEGEVENAIEQKDDVWTFDNSFEPYRPLKHIAYDEKGKIKFTENWSYSDSEPIKYQMKDCHKKVVSILKETQDNDSNLRREHIFYDNNGKITMSLAINYDGANISRLTFYNSHDTIDSVSIITEYSNGNKLKELIYNEDYELRNTVKALYLDDQRKSIQVFDSDNAEILKISS